MRSLKVTEANRAWGRNYSREFRAWIKRHGFDKMAARATYTPRSRAL